MTASTTAEMSAPIADRGRSGQGRIDWAGYLFVAFFTLPFLLFNVAPIFFGITSPSPAGASSARPIGSG